MSEIPLRTEFRNSVISIGMFGGQGNVGKLHISGGRWLFHGFFRIELIRPLSSSVKLLLSVPPGCTASMTAHCFQAPRQDQGSSFINIDYTQQRGEMSFPIVSSGSIPSVFAFIHFQGQVACSGALDGEVLISADVPKGDAVMTADDGGTVFELLTYDAKDKLSLFHGYEETTVVDES